MNRLANALLFAVVVMTAFVLEVRTSHPQYSPGHLLARVMQRATPAPAPVYVGSIPQAPDLPDFDDADLQRVVERSQRVAERAQRVVERSQRAQEVLMKVNMQQVERHARMAERMANTKCTVVRVDQ